MQENRENRENHENQENYARKSRKSGKLGGFNFNRWVYVYNGQLSNLCCHLVAIPASAL